MDIYLGDHFDALIRTQVESGRFANASEVVREGLRLFEEQERSVSWLRTELRIAADQVERGELIDFTPELLDRLSREAEENARNGKPVKNAVTP